MTSSERPTNIRWLVFVLASATSFMLYLHRYTWAVIRPELEREYGFTNTQLEQIFAFFQFTYSLGQIPGGMISDFFGPHIFLGASILTWSVCLLVFALVGSFWVFGGIRMLFGAAQAGAYPSLNKVTSNWFAPSSRTALQGFIASTAGRAGGALAPILMATVLMAHFGYGWRTALLILSGAGILFAIAFLLLFRNSPENDSRVNEAERALIHEGEQPKTNQRSVLPFKKAFKNRNFQLLVFQQYANAGADIVYTSVLGSFFLSKNISLGEMGIYASLPLFGGAIGGFVGGVLNDVAIQLTGSRKWGRRLLGCLGKAIAAGCLFIAISQTSVAALAWGLFVVKFFSDWSQPTVWGTCTDLGRQYSGTTFSIVNFTGNVGAFTVPFVVGPLLDHYTTVEIVNGVSERVTNYDPMFAMVAGLYLVSSITWLFIDCTRSFDGESND